MKEDANDFASRNGAEALKETVQRMISTAPVLDQRKLDVARSAPAFDIERYRIPIFDLLRFDFKNDPSVLLSDGWLTKGQVGGVIGQTGVGKSSFGMQLACHFCLGQSIFGIQPVRPLKVVVIQGENSKRICARELQGIMQNVSGMKGGEDDISKRLLIFKVSDIAGMEFHRFLRCVMQRERPDLVLIDPWYSYIGGSVNDQALVTQWLRNGLQALCDEFDIAILIVHHTPKPLRDLKSNIAYSGGDWSYFGAGSAEFANFCRVILTLRELSDGLYELRAAKNQERWPLTQSDAPDAPKTNLCYLQRGDGAIFWSRASSAALATIQDVSKGELDEILDALKTPPSGGWHSSEIIDTILKIRGGKRSGAKTFFYRDVKPHLNGPVVGIYTTKVSKFQEVSKSF